MTLCFPPPFRAGPEGGQGGSGAAQDGEEHGSHRGGRPQATEQRPRGGAEGGQGRGEGVQVQGDPPPHRLLRARGGECGPAETGYNH